MTKQLKSVFLLFVFVIGAVSVASAQKEQTVFRSFGLSGIWGGSKHQLASFGNSNSYMRGGHFGLEFGKRLYIGFSNMSLKSDARWDQIQDQDFGLNWRGGTVGYAFAAHKAIHPIVNVDFGPGKVKLANDVDRIFALQPSLGVEINVFRWLHLGLEGGYRFISDSNLEGLNDAALSGGFGQATLRFGWSWGRTRHNKHREHHTSSHEKYND